MENFNVHTFAVGQGLFNFVCEQYTEGEEEKTYCGIIDCGSHTRTKADFKNRIEEIAAEMKAKYHNAPLDYVIISHQDDDHWSYLIDFLQSYYEFSFSNWNIRGVGNKLFRVWENQYGERCGQWGNQYFYHRVFLIDSCFNICKSFPRMTMSDRGGSIRYNFLLGKECRIVMEAVRGEDTHVKVVKTTVKAKQIPEEIWKYAEPIAPDNIDKGCIAEFIYGIRIFGRVAERAILEMLTEVIKNLDINIAEILQNEGTSGKEIYIKRIMTGGFDWGMGAEKIREILRLIGRVYNYPCTLFQVENRKWHFVCDNGFYDIKRRTKNEIRRNASSLMIYYVCNQGNVQYSAFFPGDATFHSFDSCLKIIKEQEMVIDYLVAPHHGSYKTNIVLDESRDEAPYQRQPLSKFVNTTEPQNVVFSAMHDIFGHPNERVAEILAAETRVDAAEHLFMSYGLAYSQENRWEEEYCINTEKGIYTTECSGDITYTDNEVTFTKSEENAGLQKCRGDHLTVLDDMFI